MHLNATNFIKNRNRINSITYNRITHIMWYVAECYEILKKDNPRYSKSWIRTNTTHKHEDYLKMELVDKYLIPNKNILRSKISSLIQVNFSYENQKRYIDSIDGKEKPDKIDIFINKLGLQKIWQQEDENLYLAIECKRISILSDTGDYIADVRKFTQRNHTDLRLPFEGMIAFIENNRIDHIDVSNETNCKLNLATDIVTKQMLSTFTLHNDFGGAYLSTHEKSFGQKEIFSIFHLLFDYSNIVID